MTISIFLIAGVAFAIVATYVTVSRAYEVAEPVLVGETTAVGLADPESETMSGHNSNNNSQTKNDWQLTTLSALCDAEDLLDCLESQGYKERELLILGNSCFAVRYR